MDHLNDSKINCPRPLKTKNKNYLIKLKNKTACIVTFLKGKDKKKVNESDCYAIGKTIAKMHLVTKKIKLIFNKHHSQLCNFNSKFCHLSSVDSYSFVLHKYPIIKSNFDIFSFHRN